MAYTNSNSSNKAVRAVRPLTKKERLQRWRMKEEAREKARDAFVRKHPKGK